MLPPLPTTRRYLCLLCELLQPAAGILKIAGECLTHFSALRIVVFEQGELRTKLTDHCSLGGFRVAARRSHACDHEEERSDWDHDERYDDERARERREHRLGESTVGPDQLEEAERIAELMEPGSDRIDLVDVTPVNRTRNFHNFSLETPEFFDDLYLRLSNRPIPRSRLLYPVRAPEGQVYWVLTRGR